MKETESALDGKQTNAPEAKSDKWASIAADVRQDPHFNDNIKAANEMTNRYHTIFKQLDKDHNGFISSTEIDSALADPAFAADSKLLNFMKHDYDTLRFLGWISENQDRRSGLNKESMDSLSDILDPARSKSKALSDGAGAVLSGAFLGGVVGYMGTQFATASGYGVMGAFAFPIGTASLPVTIGATALAATGAAAMFGYHTYKSELNYYNSIRPKLYSDLFQ